MVTPYEAYQQARALNPYNKNSARMPKRPTLPPGTDSFKRFVLRLGYLVDLFEDQCQSDPFVLVETAIPAILHGIGTVLDPDIKEVYHLIDGHSLVCSLKQEIQDGQPLGDSIWDGAKRWLFRTAEFIDKLVWDLFIAAVLEDGLIEWEATAQTMSGCKGIRSLGSSSTPFGATTDLHDSAFASGYDWRTSSHTFPAFPANISLRRGQSGYIVWSCGGQTDQGFEVPMTSRIKIIETGQILEERTSIDDGEGGWHNIITRTRVSNTELDVMTVQLQAHATVDTPHHIVLPTQGFCAISPFP